MSNLLKSKFLIGVMVVAIMLVGVVAVSATKADAATCSTGTTTLRVGSRGDAVKCLQLALDSGIAADGVFGPLTKARLVAWQKTNNLVADGIFGAKSRAVLILGDAVVTTYPAGCTSAVGFSPTTGLSCANVVVTTTYPAGCTSAVGFSPTTGLSCATGTVVTASGPVTVALASDNPASGSFIVTASAVPFAKFAFTGAGTVTSVKLQRTGVSSSSTVSNVYLYDGATRLTDGASVGSDNTVTFNNPSGLFTVAGTKTITVVADTAVADYSLGFTLISYTSGGTASTVSVAGNLMYGATATLAVVTMSSATGSGDTDAGADITVWQGTATVATRDVLLKRLALRNVGSIASADINNFKLYADGVLVQTVANLDSSGYVTFDTSVALRSGARVLKVTADVLGGSGRTVQMSLRGSYDLQATDTQYNMNGISSASFPFGPTAFTVNSGTLTVVKKTDSQASNVTLGASDQSLATYTFTAYGEPIKVETLRVGMITNGTQTEVTLRNVRILVNGAQVGSNTAVPAAATFAVTEGTSFTTNFIVTPGTPATVEIRADIVDSENADNFVAGSVTTVKALFVGGDINNATRQLSLGMIDVPSTTANVEGNNLTIASGSMSLAKTSNYGIQTAVLPATAFKIGSFQLTGNSTEAVNLNTIYVGWTTASLAIEPTELSNLYLVYGGTTSSNKGTVSGSLVTDTVSENSNSWSISKTLEKNGTLQIDVYATLASSLTGAVQATLAVAGTTASSGIATYADLAGNTSLSAGVVGQLINVGTGTIAAGVDASTPNAAIVDDSGTVTSAAFKFVSTNDAYTITDMTVAVTDPSAVSTITLMDGTSAVVGGSKSAAASVSFSGLVIPVAANATKVITVQLTMSGVGSGMGATGGALLTTLTAATARDTAGASSTPTGLPKAGNAMYVYKAIPTITNVTLPTSTLAAGTVTLAKFTVASNGGTIAWSKLLATVTVNIAAADDAITLPTLWDVTSGAVQVAAAGSFVTGLSNASGSITVLPDVEQQISGSKTYELRATLAGTVATNDSIQTSITQPSSFLASLKAFKTNAASGLGYYDKAGAPTAVTIADKRMVALSSVVAASSATTVISTAVNNVRDSYGLTAAADNGKTVIVSATVNGGGDDYLGTITGTLETDSAFTCSAWTVADGGGTQVAESGTALLSTVNSIKCTATGKQVIFNVTGQAEPGAITNTITLTVVDGAYAIGSAVAANESDLNLVTVAGNATTVSLVWSDLSAPSHSIVTADWTNGFLVSTLPTSSQNLSK